MRVLLFLLLTTVFTSAQGFDCIIKTGFDFAGRHTIDTQNELSLYSENMDHSVSFAFETTYNIQKIFDFGAGIMYKPKRNGDVNKNIDLVLLPVYGILKLNIVTVESVNPQLLTHIGYTAFSTSEEYKNNRIGEGNTYFALGVALNPYSKLYTEFLFSTHNFSYNRPGGNDYSKHDIQYTNVTLFIGWIL